MQKVKKLVIVGDSSFAEIAYEYFTHDSPYEVVAFSVEQAHMTKTDLMGLPIVAFETLVEDYPPAEYEVFVAVVYTQLNHLRARLYQTAKNNGYRLASYISNKAFIWRNVTLGEHCFIFENNVIQAFSSIGNNVIMWSGNHIGHHTSVGNHCFIASHVVISGHCAIGDYCFFGVNAAVADRVTVAAENIVGANALVTRATQKKQVYKGKVSELAQVDSYQVFKVDLDHL